MIRIIRQIGIIEIYDIIAFLGVKFLNFENMSLRTLMKKGKNDTNEPWFLSRLNF